MTDIKTDILYGINPITEALKASKRKCFRIILEEGKSNPRLKSLIKSVQLQNIKIEIISKSKFKKLYLPYAHQGIVGYFSIKSSITLDNLISNALEESEHPILILLDGIQDPQNLGAIIRSAEAMGIHGIVLPKHRVAPLNETALPPV